MTPPLIRILNPNGAADVTARLAAAARAHAQGAARIEAWMAEDGPARGIATPAALAAAEAAVLRLAVRGRDAQGLVIGAFGDPGLGAARAASRIPVAGLGEAGIRAAAAHGRFAVLTLGPAMHAAIAARIEGMGLADRLDGIEFLDAAIPEVAADPARFAPKAREAAARAAARGAQALLLGGAPFAGMGRVAGLGAPIPVLDGLAEAIDALLVGIRAGRAVSAER